MKLSGQEDKISEKINAASNLAKAVPIYDDALKPIAIETGKALSTVGRAVNVALSPIRGLVWGAEHVEAWLNSRVASKLEKVDENNIITPDVSIAGPTIEALRFQGQKPELSDLFAGLLASAMDKSTYLDVHPSFVDFIKSLSSQDAQLLALLFRSGGARPLINVKRQNSDQDGQATIVKYFAQPDLLAVIATDTFQLERFAVSLENLARMKIVNITFDAWLTSDKNGKAYEELEKQKYINDISGVLERAGASMKCGKGFIELTELGNAFCRVCIGDLKN